MWSFAPSISNLSTLVLPPVIVTKLDECVNVTSPPSKLITPPLPKCKSFHPLLELPKSYVASASGIIFDFISPPRTISSPAASPILILPPRVILPFIFAFPANSNLPNEPVVIELPLTFALSIINACVLPLSTTNLPNEPVEIEEPDIKPKQAKVADSTVVAI